LIWAFLILFGFGLRIHDPQKSDTNVFSVAQKTPDILQKKEEKNPSDVNK
jgi:hypothetical protein